MSGYEIDYSNLAQITQDAKEINDIANRINIQSNVERVQQGNAYQNEFAEQQGLSAEQWQSAIHKDANTYMQYRYNLAKNNPSQFREDRLNEAIARNKQLLQGEKAQQDLDVQSMRNSGVDERVIQDHIAKENQLSSMSGSERLRNYLARKNGDPNTVQDVRFEQDMATLDVNALKARYGEEVASYKFEETKQKFSTIAQATANAGGYDKRTSDFSSDSAANIGRGVLAKGAETVGGIIDFARLGYGVATGDEEVVKDIVENPNWFKEGAESLRENGSASLKAQTTRNNAQESIWDNYEEQKKQELINEGESKETASSKAGNSRNWEQFKDSADNLEELSTGVAEIGVDLVTGGLVAKGVGKVAGKVATGVANTVVKAKQAKQAQKALQLANQQAKASQSAVNKGTFRQTQYQNARALMKNGATQQQAQQAVQSANVINKSMNTANKYNAVKNILKNSGVTHQSSQKAIQSLQNRVQAIGASIGVGIHSGNQEAIGAVEDTYKNLMAIDNNKFANTKVGKQIADDLMAKHGYNKLEEALQDTKFIKDLEQSKSVLATEASLSAYMKVFSSSALVGAITSRTERVLGKISPVKSGIKGKVKDYVFKASSEAFEEFVESGSGEIFSKSSVNEQLGERVLDPTKQVGAVAGKGALIGALGAGAINALPLGKSAGEAVVQKPVKALNKKIEKAQTVKSDNDFKQSILNITTPPTTPPDSGNPSDSNNPFGGFDPNVPSPFDSSTPEPDNDNGLFSKAKRKVKDAFGIHTNLNEESQKRLDKEFEKTEVYGALSRASEYISNIDGLDYTTKERIAEHSPSEIVNILNQMQKNIVTARDKETDLAKKDKFNKAYGEIDAVIEDIQTAMNKDLDKYYAEFDDSVNDIKDIKNKDQSTLSPEWVGWAHKMLGEDGDFSPLFEHIEKLEESDIYKQLFNYDIADGNDLIFMSYDVNSLFAKPDEAEEITGKGLSDNSLNLSLDINKRFNKKLKEIDNNTGLSKAEKAKLKRKLSRQLVMAVNSIATNTKSTDQTAKKDWKNLAKVAQSIIDNLNSQEGIEENDKQILVNLLKNLIDLNNEVQRPSNGSNGISDKQALTLLGKYVGTSTGGYKGKGNIGLLAYAQLAIANKGKLDIVNTARLAHFYATQDSKLQALEKLHAEWKADIDAGKADYNEDRVLENKALKKSKNTRTQDGNGDTTFNSIFQLEAYRDAVKKDQERFVKLAGNLIQTTTTKSKKVSGTGATKDSSANTGSTQSTQSTQSTSEPKQKQEKKEKKTKPENKQQSQQSSTQPEPESKQDNDSRTTQPDLFSDRAITEEIDGVTHFNADGVIPNVPSREETEAWLRAKEEARESKVNNTEPTELDKEYIDNTHDSVVKNQAKPNETKALIGSSVLINRSEKLKELNKDNNSDDNKPIDLNTVSSDDLFSDDDLNSSLDGNYRMKGVIDFIPTKEDIDNEEDFNRFKSDFSSYGILPNGFTLTNDQYKALFIANAHIENVYAGSAKGNVMTISGFAGTGKTTVIDYLFKYRQEKYKEQAIPKAPIYITPTHASGSVISQKSGILYQTVNSFTNNGIFFTTDHSNKKNIHFGAKLNTVIKPYKDTHVIRDFRTEDQVKNLVIVVDEVSMVSSVDLDKLINKSKLSLQNQPDGSIKEYSDVPVILLGDYMQLPPVSGSIDRIRDQDGYGVDLEKVSQAFTSYPLVELTEVKRTSENSVLTTLDHIRNSSSENIGKIPDIGDFYNVDDSSIIKFYEPTDSTKKGKYKHNDGFFDNAVEDLKANPLTTKIITYENAGVKLYNHIARNRLLGVDASSNPKLQQGDTIIGYESNSFKDPTKAQIGNSLQYKVKNVGEPSSTGFLIKDFPDGMVGTTITLEPNEIMKGLDFKDAPIVVATSLFPDSLSMDLGISEEQMAKNVEVLEGYLTKEYANILTSTNYDKPKDLADTLAGKLGNIYLTDSYKLNIVIEGGNFQIKILKDTKSNWFDFIKNENGELNSLRKALGTTLEDNQLKANLFAMLYPSNSSSLAELHKGMDFGYAVTIHKSQGMTIDNVYFAMNQDPNSYKKVPSYITTDKGAENARANPENTPIVGTQQNSLNYVAMSRSASKVRVLVNKEDTYVPNGSPKSKPAKFPNNKELTQGNTIVVTDTPKELFEDYTHIDDFNNMPTQDEIEAYYNQGTQVTVSTEVREELIQESGNNPELLSTVNNLVPAKDTVPFTERLTSLERHIPNSVEIGGEVYANGAQASEAGREIGVSYIGYRAFINKEYFDDLRSATNIPEDSNDKYLKNLRSVHTFISKHFESWDSYSTDGRIKEKMNKINAPKLEKAQQTILDRSSANFYLGDPKLRDNIKNYTAMKVGASISNIRNSDWLKTSGQAVLKKINLSRTDDNNEKLNKLSNEFRLRGLNLYKKDDELILENVLLHKDVRINPIDFIINPSQEEGNKYIWREAQKAILDKYGDNKPRDNGNYYEELDAELKGDSVANKNSKFATGMGVWFALVGNKFQHSLIDITDGTKFRANGLFNFLTIDQENKKWELPAEMPTAMAIATAKALQHDRIAKGSRVWEDYSENGKYELYLETLTKDNINKTMESSQESYKTKDGSVVEATNDSLATLGTEKGKFVTDLGMTIMREMGITLKDDSRAELDFEATAFSLGVSGLQILVEMGVVKINRLVKVDLRDEAKGVEGTNVFIDHVSFHWDKTNPYSRTLEELKNSFHSPIAEKMLGKEVSKMGGISTEPFKATVRDLENKTSTGKNKTLEDGVNAHNNIPFNFTFKYGEGNTERNLGTAMLDNEDTYLAFLYGDLNADKNLDAVNVSEEAKRAQTTRELQIVRNYLDIHGDSTDLYIKHKSSITQRNFMDSDLNPTANKTQRELFKPKTKFYDEEGKEIAWGIKLGSMSYSDLLHKAWEMVLNPQPITDETDVFIDQYVNVTGYALALAQAFEIKIENLYEPDAIQKLIEIVNKPEVKAIIDNMADYLTGGTLDKEKLKQASKFELNTPIGFHALMSLAQIQVMQQNGESNNLFQPLLFIEADGKGNGVNNNNRQFTTNLSESYFNTLKRTGHVTADLLVKALLDKKKITEIEGSKYLADKSNPEDSLLDVYEVVSDALHKRIQDNTSGFIATPELIQLLDQARNDIKQGNLNTKTGEKRSFAEAMQGFVNTLTNPEQFGFDEEYARQMLGLIYTEELLKWLDGVTFEEGTEIVKSIKRSIAKIAVTPSNYGGQVDGITSQLFQDVKKLYKIKLNDIYQRYLQDPSKEQDLLIEAQQNAFILNSGAVVNPDSKLSFKERLNEFAEFNAEQRQNSYKFLTSTVGNSLNTAISDAYGEQFSVIRAIVNLDTAMFNAFNVELQDSIKNFLDRRNKENGWVDEQGNVINPKAYDFLTKRQMRVLLSNLKNVPNVGTAMSDNTILVNELVNSGNSITKETSQAIKHGKATVTSMARFQNDAVNMVQAVMTRHYDAYRSAGASLLTSSIVSTEALTQNRLIQSLSKQNIFTNDTFDGINSLPIFRFKIGQEANRITDEIHNEVSLIENFYNYARRSNIIDNVEYYYEIIDSKESDMVEMRKALTTKDATSGTINAKTILAMLSALGVLNFDWELHKDPEQAKYRALQEKINPKKFESNNRDNFANLLHTILEKHSSSDIVPVTTSELKMLQGAWTLLEEVVQENKARSVLNEFRNLAIESRVSKDIENMFFGKIVNQFAGVSNGYISLTKTQLDTLKRFKKFVEAEGFNFADLALRNNSELLAKFAKQDDKIIEKSIQLRTLYAQRILQADNQVSNTFDLKGVKDTNSLFDKLEEHFQVKEEQAIDRNDFSLDVSYYPVVTHILREMVDGKNLKVTDSLEDFASRLNTEQKERVLNDTASQGIYSPRAGIYLRTDPANNNSIDTKTAVHELIHAGTNDIINTYYLNPENLSSNKSSAMKLMEAIAHQLADKFLNNSDFIKVQEYLQQQNEFNVNNAYSITPDMMIATCANIQYVFSKEFADKHKGNPEVVAKAKAKVMQEMLAYGLTNLAMLNYLSVNGLRGRKEVLEQTGFKKAWESMKNILDSMFNAFLNMFGYTSSDKTNNSDKSFLADLTRAMMVMQKDTMRANGELTTDSIPNSEINTTSFNNNTFADTNDAFNSLGSINGNSQEHTKEMKDLYESINGKLKDIKYRTYVDAYNALKDNTFNQDAIDELAELRASGLPITNLDENMFKLMRAVNKVNMENNEDYRKEATRAITQLMSLLPSGFRGNTYEAMANLEPEGLLALVQTHESIRKDVDAIYQSDPSKLQNFGLFRGVYKQLDSNKVRANDLDKLANISAKLIFDGRNSMISEVKNNSVIAKRSQRRLDAYRTVADMSDALTPKQVSSVIKLIGSELFSGDIFDKNTDTGLERGLEKIANASALLANRPTLVSKIIGYFLGATDNTQYIYSIQGRQSIVGESVRQKVGDVINSNITNAFGRVLTKKEHKALTEAYFRAGLNHLYNYDSSIEMKDVLLDDKFRKDLERVLWHRLKSEYPNDINIERFLEWQTSGLAELNIKGTAKSTEGNKSSFILPNGKAIAGLTLLEQVGYKKVTDSSLSDKEILVNALVAVKSVKHLSDENKAIVGDMLSKDSKAMRLVTAEANLTHKRSYSQYPDTFAGYMNYQHETRNPNNDYQVVEPNDKDKIEFLKSIGYEKKLTLSDGSIVFATNQSISNNITNGLLSIVETSVLGADIKTQTKMGSRGYTDGSTNMNQEFRDYWNQVKKVPSYYDSLTVDSNKNIDLNYSGDISSYSSDITLAQRDELLGDMESSYDHLGDYQARQLEELTTVRDNQNSIKVLNDAYNNAEPKDKKNYILLDGNYKAKGNSNEDKRFAKHFNNFYRSLPLRTKNIIENQGGLYVHRRELDNIIGYEQASLTDMFVMKSGMPEVVQKAFRATFTALLQEGIGVNPVKVIKQAERIKAEATSVAKDFVLNRSVVVPALNLFSNVIHLWTAGVPVSDIPKLIVRGYQEVQLYNKYQKELLSINHTLGLSGVSAVERRKLMAQQAQLGKLIDKLSITPLMNSGIYTNISDKEVGKDDYTMLNDFSEKFGINKIRNSTPTPIKNLFIMEGSKMHSYMEEFMNYGDFVAKYALYTHMTSKGVEPTKAMNVIRDEFINYASNRGREFDWMNKMGITWFLSYKLGIQRIIYRNLRRNTLKTLATWSAINAVNRSGIPIIQHAQAVPQQIFWTDYSGYHFELDNMIDSFGAHWIEKVLF